MVSMRTSNLRKILEKDTERTANSCEAPSETLGDSGCRDISKTTSTNGCQAHNVHKNLPLTLVNVLWTDVYDKTLQS
jgi:hypothetical protein